jgi:hypothetical protein
MLLCTKLSELIGFSFLVWLDAVESDQLLGELHLHLVRNHKHSPNAVNDVVTGICCL